MSNNNIVIAPIITYAKEHKAPTATQKKEWTTKVIQALLDLDCPEIISVEVKQFAKHSMWMVPASCTTSPHKVKLGLGAALDWIHALISTEMKVEEDTWSLGALISSPKGQIVMVEPFVPLNNMHKTNKRKRDKSFPPQQQTHGKKSSKQSKHT